MIARLYSNENFPLPVVAALRGFGHDVLTSHSAPLPKRKLKGAAELPELPVSKRLQFYFCLSAPWWRTHGTATWLMIRSMMLSVVSSSASAS